MKKTTISVYYSFYSGLYVGYLEWFDISFYGSRAEELRDKWLELREEEDKRLKAEWNKKQREKIKEFEKELSMTPRTLFNTKRRFLEKEIKEEKKRTYNGISAGSEKLLVGQFVTELGGVLISTGDNTKIYEV